MLNNPKLILFLMTLTFVCSNYINIEVKEEVERIQLLDANTFSYHVEVKSDLEYAIFKTKTEDDNNFIQMDILLNYEQEANEKNYQFASNLYIENNLVVKTKKSKDYYITIKCPREKCQGYLFYYTKNVIDLSNNDHFEFIGGEEYVVSIKPFFCEKLQFFLLSPQLEFSNFVVGYYENNSFKELKTGNQNLLINDYKYTTDSSLIINIGDNPNVSEYIIILKGNDNAYMRFTTRVLYQSSYKMGEPAFYSVKTKTDDDFLLEECVSLVNIKTNREYQLRLINTYALQIRINNKIINFGYLTSHYEIFEKNELKEGDFLCFKSLEKTNKSEEIVDTIKQAFFFQFIDQNSENAIDSIVEPLYEGNRYIDKIYPKGQRFYRHARKSKSKTYSVLVVKQGIVNVRQGKCITFPYCKLDISNTSNYENLNDLIYAFGAYVSFIESTIESSMADHNRVVTILECKSEKVNCIITLEYIDEDDGIVLKENENFAKHIPKDSSDKYFIVETSFSGSDEEKIEINFDIYSGDATLTFDLDKERTPKKIKYGNSQKYIFEGKGIERIQITVKAVISSYYVLSYRIISEKDDPVSIKESGLLLQYLEKKGEKKNYIIQHNLNNAIEKTFFAHFIPLNCEIDVTFKSNIPLKKSNSGEIQQVINTLDHFFDQELSYNIELKDYKQQNQNKCYYYMGASEATENIPFLVRENTPFTITLSKKYEAASYVFPYSLLTGNSIVIKVNLDNELLVEVKVFVNTFMIDEVYQISKSKIIEIGASQLSQNCQQNFGCSIYIHFKLIDKTMKDDDEIPITFSVNTGKQLTSILNKGVLRREAIATNRIYYFSMEVLNNEEGEIILDMKRGSGTMFGKLYNKDMLNVELPNEKSSNLLPYDEMNQKLKYSNKNDGDSEGKILYVGVASRDKYSDNSDNLFYFDFNIYARTIYSQSDFSLLKKSIVSISMNEFISGSLEQKMIDNYYDVYSLYISDNIDGIEIEFYSLSTSLFINFNDDSIPTMKSKCKILASSKDQILRIDKYSSTCELLKGVNKIKGGVFRISVGTEDFETGKNSPYLFRVRPIKTNVQHIIEIDSDKETTCEIKDSNNYCHFLISLNSYDTVSELFAYTFSEGTSELILYVNIIDSKTYYECKNDETCLKKKVLATEQLNHKNTKEQLNKNYISIDNELNPKSYVFIGVKSNKPDIISFVSTFRTYTKETIPIPLFIQLLPISYNQMTIKLERGKNYIVSIMNIDGNGPIVLKDFFNKKEYQYDLKGNEMLFLDSQGYESQLIIDTPKIHYVGIWYDLRNTLRNIDELRIGKYTTLNYHQNFPFGFYTLIPDRNEDYLVEFKLLNIDQASNEKNTFQIVSYIVSETMVSKLKIKEDSYPDDNEKINGYFDNDLLTGRVFITSKNLMNTKQNYIYTEIRSLNKNKKYNNVTAGISIYPSRSPFEASPQGIYFSGSISSKKTSQFLLKKYSKEGNSFLLDLQISNPEGKYRIVDSKNNQIKDIKEISGVGKKLLNISSNDPSIYLIIGEENKDNDFDFSFRYFTGNKAQEPILNSLKDNSVTFKLSNINRTSQTTDINLKFKGIQSSNKDKEFVYYIKIYNVKSNNNYITTYALIRENPKFEYEKKSKSDEIVYDIKNIPIYSDILIYGIDKSSGEFFGYKSIKISENTRKSKEFPLWVVFALLFLAIAILVGGIIKYLQMSKERDTLRNRINQLSVTISGSNIPEAKESLLGKNNFD